MVGGREREGSTGMRKKAVHLRRAGGDCSRVSRQLQGLEYTDWVLPVSWSINFIFLSPARASFSETRYSVIRGSQG